MHKKYAFLYFVFFTSILFLPNLVDALTATLGNSRIILDMKIGESMERYIIVKNTNSVSVKIEMTASGDLEKSVKIKDSSFTLSPNEEKNAFFTIKATKSGTTETRLNVRFIPEEGNAVGLSAMIIVNVSEPEIVYILKDPTKADSALLEEINKTGFTTEIISENKIRSTDFSKYRMIIVGDQDFNNPELIPFEKYRSIIINSYNYAAVSNNPQFGWSANFGSKSSPSFLAIYNFTSPITLGAKSKFNAYSVINPLIKTSYLKGKKAAGINIIATTGIDAEAVVASVEKGARFLNDKTARERSIFFGATQAEYWTAETRKIFNNSFYWVLYGEDRDKDGFFSDIDCRDNDLKSYPGAEEIPYDGIDQNCDGRDLIDVDVDKFASVKAGGEDCDDNNGTINPENPDPLLNCVNDSPIIELISEISGKENDKIIFTVRASDPENDTIRFNINDSKIIVQGNKFTWQTSYDDSGIHHKTISVSDGKDSSTQEVEIIVENVNREPRFIGLPLISFDEDSSFILDLSSLFLDDDRDDSISYSVEQYSDERKINASFIDRNNILLKFEPVKDWNGEEIMMVSASDGESKVISPRIRIAVSSINDAPIFKGKIEDITLDEDLSLQNFLDLKKYFSDPDSNLRFSVFGNESIEIKISERGLVSFFPKRDWNGDETVVFLARDETSNIISNQIKLTINPKDEIPVLSLVNCLTSIKEEEIYECEISTSDLENDSISLRVAGGNKLYCDIENNKLVYSAHRDYNGKASCEIEISDKDGLDEYLLEVDVIQVNDAPIITEFLKLNQVIIPEGLTQSFFVSLYDPDSVPIIEWFLDNDKIKSESTLKSSYNYVGLIGEHTIKAIIADYQFTETKIWAVNVINKTDSLYNHPILNQQENIETNIKLNNNKYSFTSMETCAIKNNSLEIRIRNPDSKDEFNPGDIIEGEIEVRNKLDKKQSLKIKTHIYDLDKQDSLDSSSLNMKVNKNDKELDSFRLDIPENIDSDHNYIIYARAEDDICNDLTQTLKLEKPEHKIIIKSLNVPKEAECNSNIQINVKIKNVGDNEENLLISVDSPGLNIKTAIPEFSIEENGKKDIATKNILISIPQNAEGNFVLRTNIDYNLDRIIGENNISISCDNRDIYIYQEQDNYSDVEETELVYPRTVDLIDDTQKSSLYLTKLSLNSSQILVIILSFLNLIFVIGILYMSKWLRI